MTHPWVQITPGTESFVLDFLPFESALATLPYSGRDKFHNSPSILSVVGDKDVMATAGMALTAINNLPFKVYANAISLRPDKKIKPDFPCQATQYPLEKQTSKGFLYRASHLLSDVICFRAADIDTAADELIDWHSKCLMLELTDRPAACILLPNGTDHQSPEGLLKELETALEKKIRTKSIQKLNGKDIVMQVFRDLEVFRVCSLEEPFPDGVIDQLTLSRRLRMANRHLWTHEVFRHLAKSVISHTSNEARSPLRFAKTMDMIRLHPVTSSGPWLIQQWNWWFRQADSLEVMTKTLIPIMAGCLARNSMMLGHGELSNTDLE